MRRFLVANTPRPGDRVSLPEPEAKHAALVLRLGVGAEIRVTDGRGTEAAARITRADESGVEAEIEFLLPARAQRCQVCLLQAQLKGPRMDWLVEKLTELGLDQLWPVHTQRSVAKSDKEDRWARLSQAALKQSGNTRALTIHTPGPLAAALTDIQKVGGLKLLLIPGAERSLAAAIGENPPDQIILATGPEGGFTAEEEALLLGQGFEAVALSPQILRGETAGIAAVAIALHLVDF